MASLSKKYKNWLLWSFLSVISVRLLYAWINFFSSVHLSSVNLFIRPARETKKGREKFSPPQQPDRFYHNVPVELIASTGISVRVSKQREVTGHRRKAAVLKKTVSVRNWFSALGSMSHKLPSLVIVPLRFSTFLRLSLIHWTLFWRDKAYFLLYVVLWSNVSCDQWLRISFPGS